MSWWQVSIEVPASHAETLAALLAEDAGLAVEVQDQTTMTRSEGEARVVIGMAEAPSPELVETVTTWLARLGLPGASVQTHFSEDDSWRDGWKAFFRGSRLSARLWVRPPWEAPDPEAHSTIVIDPGMAFGTGQHETTRGVLRLLDDLLAARPGASVLDVGCGSGILAIAAARLGSPVLAVDIDAEALRNAQENVALNALEEQIELRVGSIDAAEGRFEVVVANILAVTLIELAPELSARCSGDLLLSGLLTPDADRVRAAFPGLEEVCRTTEGEWSILQLRVLA